MEASDAAPLLVLCLVVFVAFLGVLAGLAVAVTKTIGPNGRVSRGLFASLGSIFALLFLCGLGLVGTGLFGGALLLSTAIAENPVESIEFHRGEDFLSRSSREQPGELRVSLRGDRGRALVRGAAEHLGLDREELERHVSVVECRDGCVEEDPHYQLALPFTERDIQELERELARELDGVDVRLPEDVVVRFR